MKQQPTLQQWNELIDDGTARPPKYRLWAQLGLSDLCLTAKCKEEHLPTIGQMIEFLGEDWQNKTLESEFQKDHSQTISEAKSKYLLPERLCNNLFEAVVRDLNNR